MHGLTPVQSAAMSVPLPGRTLAPARGTFRALRHRDFRLLWAGQLVSLSGTWMQSVAQGWLVLRITDSVFYLGLVGFCSYLPVMLLALVGGVAADRLPRRKALLWTQAAAMALALVLAGLTWFDLVRVWHVALLALGLGTVSAFDIPIRQSFLQELVGRDDLQNAIALNSMAFNSARLAGPSLAGLVVAVWGEAVCFLLNALSFSAVLGSLFLMRTESAVPVRQEGRSWAGGIREVLAYARRTPQVRVILTLVALSSVFGMPYSILMPAFARDVLGGGSRELGFLMGSSGLGAIVGAFLLAGRRSTRHAGRIVAVSMAVFGMSLVALSASRSFALSLAILVVAGAGMIVQMATSNTFLQLLAPPSLRGRIVSLYMMSFIGMAPLGSLLSGVVARALGTPWTVGLGGAVLVVSAAVFGLRLPRYRAARAGVES
jgi:MFS family permease